MTIRPHDRPTTVRTSALLIAILAAAGWFRFSRLGWQPLWLDETITALVCLARNPLDIPIGRIVPLSFVFELFKTDSASTARGVIELLRNPNVRHTHPPLFYLIEHWWLLWRSPALDRLAWDLRSVPAVFGTLEVAAVFGLTATAFSVRAGLLASALAAVSPMAVALSQEARNYTLAILCVTLGLWTMMAIVRRTADGARAIGVVLWVIWGASNVAACYAHYYGAVAVVAQMATLVWTVRAHHRALVAAAATIAASVAAFVPWLSTLRWQAVLAGQPIGGVTGWLDMGYMVLKALEALTVGRRIEMWSHGVAVSTMLICGIVFAWLVGMVVRSVAELFGDSIAGTAARTLVTVLAVTLAEFAVLAVITRRTYLSELRYNFVLYPPVSALLGAAIIGLPGRVSPPRRALMRVLQPSTAVAVAAMLTANIANCVFVVRGVEMPKPFDPAAAPELETAVPGPALIVMGVASREVHETIGELANIAALSRQAPERTDLAFALVSRSEGEPSFIAPPRDDGLLWSRLSNLQGIRAVPASIWLHVFRRTDAPATVYRPVFELGRVPPERHPVVCERDAGERGSNAAKDDDDASRRGPFRLYHCGTHVDVSH